MAITDQMNVLVSKYRHVDPSKHSFNARFERISKRSQLSNFIAFVIHVLSFGLIAKNRSLDTATAQLIGDTENLLRNSQQVISHKNELVRVLTIHKHIIENNGGSKKESLDYLIGRIQHIAMPPILGNDFIAARPPGFPIRYPPIGRPQPAYPQEHAVMPYPGAIQAEPLSHADLIKAQSALNRAESLSKNEKLEILDWFSGKAKGYPNILLTIRAARMLINDSDWWEAYARRIQNSRKVPPTDTLTASDINHTIYSKFQIVAHPQDNDLAPVLRSFGTTVVSCLLAVREIGFEAKLLNFLSTNLDICLEAREQTISNWVVNNLLPASIQIEVDPNRDDYLQASYGYIKAFKETQFRRFCLEFYRYDKTVIQTDRWENFKKNTLERDPRFYQQFCTPEKFKAFFLKEAPNGVNLSKERGKKYAQLNAANILQALEDAKAITEVDHFQIAE